MPQREGAHISRHPRMKYAAQSLLQMRCGSRGQPHCKRQVQVVHLTKRKLKPLPKGVCSQQNTKQMGKAPEKTSDMFQKHHLDANNIKDLGRASAAFFGSKAVSTHGVVYPWNDTPVDCSKGIGQLTGIETLPFASMGGMSSGSFTSEMHAFSAANPSLLCANASMAWRAARPFFWPPGVSFTLYLYELSTLSANPAHVSRTSCRGGRGFFICPHFSHAKV